MTLHANLTTKGGVSYFIGQKLGTIKTAIPIGPESLRKVKDRPLTQVHQLHCGTRSYIEPGALIGQGTQCGLMVPLWLQ